MQFPSYVARVFSFSFFYFKISELSNFEVLFSLNVTPTPYRSSKTFFWIKLQSQTTSNVTTKKSTFIFLLSSLPPIQCCRVAKNSVSRCVSRSLINIERREKGIAEALYSFQPQLWVQKTKTSIYEISRMWILILLILLILNVLSLKLKKVLG